MSKSDKQRLIDRYLVAYNSFDLDGMLALLSSDDRFGVAPYRKPPPFEKLIGDLAGACSRRMSKHFPTASRLQNCRKALR